MRRIKNSAAFGNSLRKVRSMNSLESLFSIISWHDSQCAQQAEHIQRNSLPLLMKSMGDKFRFEHPLQRPRNNVFRRSFIRSSVIRTPSF